MRKVSCTLSRNVAGLPEGFDFEGCSFETKKVKKNGAEIEEKYALIPAEFGIFEGNETPEELDAIAKELFGETVNKESRPDEDEEPIYPKGTPVNFGVACTYAFRLPFQKAAIVARSPEGAGQLTNEQVMAITKWFIGQSEDNKNAFMAKSLEGNLVATRAFVVKAWVDAGRPAIA